MTLDREFDPMTGDYVDGPNGTFSEVEVIQNQILFSIFIELESWEGDPTIGANLEELGREKDSQINLQALGTRLSKSLQWLIDEGSLNSADVGVQSYTGGVIAFEVDAYIPGSDAKLRLPAFLVPVGNSRGA